MNRRAQAYGPVRWSESIERNVAYGSFPTACQSARHKHRTGGVAHYVLRGAAENHLDNAAMAISADE